MKCSKLVFTEQTVTKFFDSIHEFQNELRVYQSELPNTPKLVEYSDVDPVNICIRRVWGTPYLDNPEFPIDLLASSIAKFHLATFNISTEQVATCKVWNHKSHERQCLCHYDNQPRNILYDGLQYTFIDFSDSRFDFPETDVSHLLLFWAHEYGISTFTSHCLSFIHEYMQHLKLDAKHWHECLEHSILRFDERRKKYCKQAPIQPMGVINQNRIFLFNLFSESSTP